MKPLIALFAVALAAGTFRPAAAAELKILEPKDCSIVKGAVRFKIQPVEAPNERFLKDPEVLVQDENGKNVQKMAAVLDPKTGIGAAAWDSTRVPDGLYLVAITYQTLKGSASEEEREDLTIGVRNGAVKPAKFVVELQAKDYHPGEAVDVAVKVYDQRGKLMPGARVAFKVDKGEMNTDVEISDSTGEVLGSVDSDDPQTVTLTVTVENLPPVMKTIKFVK
jgi:hypothetical protein